MNEAKQSKNIGTVMRNMREEDRVYLSRDGEQLGYICLARVPNDVKVKVAFVLDRSIRIAHEGMVEAQP